jgi:molybdopterin-binding protein
VRLSTRNQLKGEVTGVSLGGIMAEVNVDLGGGQQIVAAITRASVEELALAEGDQVTVLVKSQRSKLGKVGRGAHAS